MRILLLIPCLMLFLSNVPIVQLIPVETAQLGTHEKKSCCQGRQRGKCCKNGMMNKGGHTFAGKEHQRSKKPWGHCKRAGADCIGICMFQFTASIQEIPSYSFSLFLSNTIETGFLIQKQLDPHKALPWEPPDMV